MLSPQVPYTTSPLEDKSPLPMPIPTGIPQRSGQEYDERFVETLAQRLVPRLMPEILYHLRSEEPARARNRGMGMSLALAIVSIVLLVPLFGIVLGAVNMLGGGIVGALTGFAVVGVVMLLINILFDYMLFNAKS